jgi:hypothetical protein
MPQPPHAEAVVSRPLSRPVRASASAVAFAACLAALPLPAQEAPVAFPYEVSPGTTLLRAGQPLPIRLFSRLHAGDEITLDGAARIAIVVPHARQTQRAQAPARLRVGPDGIEALAGRLQGRALPDAAPSAADLRLAGDFHYAYVQDAGRRLVPPLSPQARSRIERLQAGLPAWRREWPAEDLLPELFTLSVVDRMGQPGDMVPLLDAVNANPARDPAVADLARRLGARVQSRSSVALLMLPFAGDRGAGFAQEVQQYLAQSGSGASRSVRTIAAAQEVEGLRVPASRSLAMVRAGQQMEADLVLFGVILSPRVSDIPVTQPGLKCIKVRRTDVGDQRTEECLDQAPMEIVCTRRSAEWQAQLTLADVSSGRTAFSDTVVGTASGDGCGFQAPPPAENLLQEARQEVLQNIREILSQSLAGVQKRFLTPDTEIRSAASRQEFGAAIQAALQGDEERACRTFRSLAEVESAAPSVIFNAATCEESEGRLEPALRLYRQAPSAPGSMEAVERLAALTGSAAAPEAPAATLTADAAGERRVALVVGNAAYGRAPLRNAVNDARDIARALSETGFDVIRVENATLEALGRALEQFSSRLAASHGVGLFFYAGHGVQVDGENFLVPVDADLRTEKDVQYRALNVGLVLARIEQARNRLNLIVLDACRDNPFARSSRGGKRGLASIDAPKGTLIAYSTAPGRTADDGEGRNGLYTRHLLREMRVPGLRIEDVFKRVRASVATESRDQQVPWESSSLTGDFYFVRP